MMNLNKKGTVEDAVSKYLKTFEFKKKISNEKLEHSMTTNFVD